MKKESWISWRNKTMNSVNWRKQYHRMNTNRYSTITRLFTRKKPSWRCSGESGAKTRGFAPSSKRDSFISKRRISNRRSDEKLAGEHLELPFWDWAENVEVWSTNPYWHSIGSTASADQSCPSWGECDSLYQWRTWDIAHNREQLGFRQENSQT